MPFLQKATPSSRRTALGACDEGCSGYLFVAVLDEATGAELEGFGAEDAIPLMDFDGRLPLIRGPTNLTDGRRYGTGSLHGRQLQLRLHFIEATVYAVGAGEGFGG